MKHLLTQGHTGYARLELAPTECVDLLTEIVGPFQEGWSVFSAPASVNGFYTDFVAFTSNSGAVLS